jgi:hypothetical protein
VSPFAHASGFGLDELIVFGTVIAAWFVYRLARGPREPVETGPDRAALRPPKGAPEQ